MLVYAHVRSTLPPPPAACLLPPPSFLPASCLPRLPSALLNMGRTPWVWGAGNVPYGLRGGVDVEHVPLCLPLTADTCLPRLPCTFFACAVRQRAWATTTLLMPAVAGMTCAARCGRRRQPPSSRRRLAVSATSFHLSYLPRGERVALHDEDATCRITMLWAAPYSLRCRAF